jgi:hypothetical protein
VPIVTLLISSDLIASQLLLEIAHCIPVSPQSVPSHFISTHLMYSQLFSPLLISSHLMSSPFLSCSQIFTGLLNWSQLSIAHVSSSYVFSYLLLFSGL